jgi:hypothetical protein
MYLLIALVFGIVAAMSAYARGRSTWAWFVIGCLIGPFAFAVLALPPKPKKGRFAECPACLAVVPSEATVCRYCRTQLE